MTPLQCTARPSWMKGDTAQVPFLDCAVAAADLLRVREELEAEE